MCCEVQGRERDGFSKPLGACAASHVEYVDSLAEGGLEMHYMPHAAFVCKRLGRNSLIGVYRKFEKRRQVGRAQEGDGVGHDVRFSHQKYRYIAYTDAFVRWTRLIATLFAYLARVITAIPQHAYAHSTFLQTRAAQRVAFGIQSSRRCQSK